jgi:hypothetical protein
LTMIAVSRRITRQIINKLGDQLSIMLQRR